MVVSNCIFVHSTLSGEHRRLDCCCGCRFLSPFHFLGLRACARACLRARRGSKEEWRTQLVCSLLCEKKKGGIGYSVPGARLVAWLLLLAVACWAVEVQGRIRMDSWVVALSLFLSVFNVPRKQTQTQESIIRVIETVIDCFRYAVRCWCGAGESASEASEHCIA